MGEHMMLNFSLGDNGPTLPHDLVVEILERLPVKSLVRFRSVAVSWCYFLKSSKFIKNHFERTKRGNKALLVRRCLQYDDEDVISLHNLNSTQQISPNLFIPFRNQCKAVEKGNPQAYSPKYVRIIGPCNGIVCVVDQDRVLLCNPAMREFRHLPLCSFESQQYFTSAISGVGFGFDSTSNAFKVVLIRHIIKYVDDGKDDHDDDDDEVTDLIVHLYTTSANSWSQIEYNGTLMDPYGHYPIECFFNGATHWPADAMGNCLVKKILCFDFTNEVFKRLEYPTNCVIEDYGTVNLSVANDCLTMLKYERHTQDSFHIDVWSMKEYGVRSSWTKQFVIKTEMCTRPLSWKDDGTLLVETACNQLAYIGAHPNQGKDLQIYGKPLTFRALIYEESLMSVN